VKPVRKKQQQQAGDGATPRQGKALADIGKLFWWLLVTAGAALVKVVVESWYHSAGS
jgi:hypothetical protein